MITLKQRASEILDRCEVVNLASVTPDGYPRPVPVSKLKSDGIMHIWISTGTSSEKTEHFRKNKKAGLSFFEEGDSVVLTGQVKMITDTKIKRELFSDWMLAHFPEGVDDPEYCLLEFETEEATFWIDRKFVHRRTRL